MKNIFVHFFSFGFIILLMGCSEEMPPPQIEEMPDSAVDVNKYLVLDRLGSFYEVGDETGVVNKLNNPPIFEVQGLPNAITSNTDMYYAFDVITESFSDNGDGARTFQGNLLEISKDNLGVRRITLDFTDEIFPVFPVLVALDWDETAGNILGIVGSFGLGIQELPYYLVRINPISFEITYTGIQFESVYITSTALVGNSYFISGTDGNSEDVRNKLFEINLATEEVKSVDFSIFPTPPYGLAPIGESSFFGFVNPNGNAEIDRTVPVNYSQAQKSFESFPTNQFFGVLSFYGKSYYNPSIKEVITLLQSPEGHFIFRFNTSTKTSKLVKLDLNTFGSDTFIIGTR